MIRQVNLLILAIALIFAAVYFVLRNSAPATVSIWGDSLTFSSNVGVIVIVSFFIGVLASTVVGLIFGLRAWLRERRFARRERDREAASESLLKARSYLVTHEWGKAQNEWERIIRRLPDDVVSRIELSRSLEGAGDIREALKVIDSARTAAPRNIEVLFRAAELNLAMGNKVAALDNLALALYHQPSARAARMARDISEDLNRLEDALEYQERLEQLEGLTADGEAARTRLLLRKLNRKADAEKLPRSARIDELRTFCRKHQHSAEALRQLAELERREGQVEAAAQSLIKAARASGDVNDWRQVAALWAEHDDAERAISALRTAIKDLDGSAKIQLELELISLQLRVGMADEADQLAGAVLERIRSNDGVAEETAQRLRVLKGYALSLRGKQREAAEVWRALAEDSTPTFCSPIPGINAADRNALKVEQPAARLSTP